jgi:hypothetical protein
MTDFRVMVADRAIFFGFPWLIIILILYIRLNYTAIQISDKKAKKKILEKGSETGLVKDS